MARTFGEMVGVDVHVGALRLGGRDVSMPTLGLKILFERELDGGIVMVVRGHAGLLGDASEVEGDMLEILPVTGNTVGIRLRRAVRPKLPRVSRETP